MTRSELLAALRVLGWTVRGLARILDRSESTVTNYARYDGVRVPEDIADWLRSRVIEAKANPPPKPTKNR